MKKDVRILVSPKYKYLQEHIRLIPELFEQEGEVVYESRNILKKMTFNGMDVVVKSFKRPHIINRIVYSFFRKSKAVRSYFYSNEILNHNFCVPDPIAVIEQFDSKLLTNSYYICCYDDGETVRSLMDGVVAGNEDKLKAFAGYTADLHRSGILHLDYSPGNILIHFDNGEYHFSLVDVNRLRIVDNVDYEMAAENFRRLCYSREVLSYIVEQYAIIRGWDAQKMEERATWYSDRFFMDFTYRRAAKKNSRQHIWMVILCFKISRSLRGLFPKTSKVYGWLFEREKQMYTTYFSPHDYRRVFALEYKS